MRIVIILASTAALALALIMAALGPGTRFGVWEFSQAFSVMRPIAMPTLVAAGAAGFAFFLAMWKARALAPLALVAALAAGAAGIVPVKMRALVDANPFIHDVTTDFADPPAIIAAADLPRRNPTAYAGGEIVRNSTLTVAEAQRQAFPDIAPIVVAADLKTAADTARKVVANMGMDILAEGPAGDSPGSGWRIEAVSTSFWYGFKDDFIVRLAAIEGGTRIDLRSKSRVGGSDLGANARRVRDFAEKLDAAL